MTKKYRHPTFLHNKTATDSRNHTHSQNRSVIKSSELVNQKSTPPAAALHLVVELHLLAGAATTLDLHAAAKPPTATPAAAPVSTPASSEAACDMT
jgi:hypothetical protein